MVREMLFEMSGIEPNRSVSPDEAVAHGAALYAHLLWETGAQTRFSEQVRQKFRLAKVKDINSHSLGIVGIDQKTGKRQVARIITKNTSIPHSNTRVFRIRRFGQSQIHIQIVEGESSDPNHCTIIGECRLTNLPSELPVGWPVNVTFAYRRDGRIFVEAEVKGAKPFQVEIDRSRRISAKDAEAWANELIGDPDDNAESAPKKPSTKPTLPPSLIKESSLKMKRPPPSTGTYDRSATGSSKKGPKAPSPSNESE
jgi:molecular chaperone DnaK